MTDAQREQREKALARSCGVCPVCGGSIYQYGTPQYAHAIGNTEVNRKKYGSFFIDSTYNGELVCSLACNASIDVGKSKGKILDKLADILIKEINAFNGGN
jgi:hypothetical protein